ncbi:MAG: hypothetical protein K2M03_07805, partial [Muribaculaceae bacterium]|nr:hypothetical protein [Muribaculaceae bacterium]
MKRVITLMALALVVSGAMAQTLNKQESKALQAFLTQNAAKGGNNAEALLVKGNNIAQTPGVTIENGHVTAINWDKKELSGTLN